MKARWPVHSRVLGAVGGALACCVLLTTSSHEASACHNTVDRRVDPAIAAIQEAERLNEAGKNKEAVARVLAVDGKAWTREMGKTALGDRGLVILARATLRSDGEVYPRMGGPAEQERERAFAWAALTLRHNLALHSDSPVAQTDYAEALSHIPQQQAEAQRMLEIAETRDVVSSAHGYAALARLRAGSHANAPSYLRAPLRALGEAKRQIEILRCSEMTKLQGVCSTAPPKS